MLSDNTPDMVKVQLGFTTACNSPPRITFAEMFAEPVVRARSAPLGRAIACPAMEKPAASTSMLWNAVPAARSLSVAVLAAPVNTSSSPACGVVLLPPETRQLAASDQWLVVPPPTQVQIDKSVLDSKGSGPNDLRRFGFIPLRLLLRPRARRIPADHEVFPCFAMAKALPFLARSARGGHRPRRLPDPRGAAARGWPRRETALWCVRGSVHRAILAAKHADHRKTGR